MAHRTSINTDTNEPPVPTNGITGPGHRIEPDLRGGTAGELEWDTVEADGHNDAGQAGLPTPDDGDRS